VSVLREKNQLQKQDELTPFNDAVMPHLDAAYNLARWLTRNDHDAEDVVQEAFLRAFKYWSGFSGRDGRAWLLTIVRNTYYTWIRQQSTQPHLLGDGDVDPVDEDALNPEIAMLKNADRAMLKAALEDLPVEFCEVIVLREMEGMSYKEIADIADVPIGTVMSRLARGRKHLQAQLMKTSGKETI
jgi:RNA polymerase sigma-70 factor (ECF subfamily)